MEGYDRNSNRLYRENTVRAEFSELYHAGGPTGGYDQLNQVTAFKRGTLNAAKNNIDVPSRTQDWTHDAQGNWSLFNSPEVGAQARDHNKQNQITLITGKTPPVYDANGNMKADENGKALTFDAWNRLATFDGATLTNRYDALGRRIVEDRTGTVDDRDLYYSANWQVLEEQEAGKLKAEYVWSPGYVDALVLRNRDTGTDGVIDQTHYVQQDANWNVTALVGLVDASWVVVERFVYDPYGAVMVLDANTWTTKSISDFDWRYLHQGGRFDVTTGLYHFRNREYSPTLGRWIQRDPIEFAGGDTNLYGYVHNGPTNGTDASGLSWLVESRGPRGTTHLYYQAEFYSLVPGVRVRNGSPVFIGNYNPATGLVERNNLYVPYQRVRQAAEALFGGMPDWNEFFREHAQETRPGHVPQGIAWREMVGQDIRNEAVVAQSQIGMLANIGITWMATPIGVGSSRFAFNMNTGRWMNVTANRVATAVEANAAQRAAMGNAQAGSRGVWDLGWAPRGLAIEQRLGGNLPAGFRVIDRFENGVATSIKSMDLAASSVTPQYITNTGRGYINSVAGFRGDTLAGTVITPQQVTGRALDLAVSPGALVRQRQALNGLVEYGRQRGVTVNIIEIPH